MRSNIEKIKESCGKKVIYVAKNNCYGLGYERIIPNIDEKVEFYAVKDLYEAKMLSLCTKKDILLLMPSSEQCLDNRFIYTVQKPCDLELLPKGAKIHIKVNSGMNRFGVDDNFSFERLCEIASCKGFFVSGAYTHLYSNEREDCIKQLELFENIAKNAVKFKHATFKSTLMALDYDGISCVRSGIDVLGCGTSFSQCVTVTSKVIDIRRIMSGDTVGYDKGFIAQGDFVVAIIAFGYNNMSMKKINAQKVLINNEFYPIISVAMDVSFVLADEKVCVNDDVVITSDREGIRLKDFAKNMRTCPHELLVSLKQR